MMSLAQAFKARYDNLLLIHTFFSLFYLSLHLFLHISAMKNYLPYTLWLTLIVLIILLLMNLLPTLSVGDYTLRKVDLLSDARQSPPQKPEEADSLPPLPMPVAKPAFADTCRSGLTCIEDYSDSTYRGMKPFYQALDKMGTLGRPVRIAVFGDSFIEADILTADLREMLQKKFGGCGVGYVDITSQTYGFRPTVKHSFGKWESHAVNDTVYFDRSKQGISNRYFIPAPNAYVELRGQKKYATLLDSCEQTSIYFYAKGDLDLMASINNSRQEQRQFAPSDDLQTMVVKGKIGTVRWTVKQPGESLFYGIALEGAGGISVDNFAMRASSGLSLRYIPEKTLRDFNKQRPYDLIILQYGLNVATQKGVNYDNYQKGILNAIAHLKKCFPESGFLLLSVGDRDYKTETGELKTMPGIKNLIRYQQHIAAESAVAFWNMYEAMGGEGSMAKLVHAKPAMANYDYTHINFRGGKHLAEILYQTLLYGKEQYDRRQTYENE